jgi:hypothetical protein
MKSESQIKHEIAALIMQSLSGDATPAELQELNRLIQSDAALVPFVVDILSQEASLSWTIAQKRCGAVKKDVAELIADSLQPELLALQPQRDLPVNGNQTPEKLSALPPISPFRYLMLAACLLLAIGSILGSIIARTFFTSTNREPVLAEVAPPLSSPEYIARVVNATSCRWSSDARFPVENNGVLRKGESLQLVEGIAEIRLEWSEGYADLRIEGPAGLVLTADHGCSLSHGKLTVDVKTITPLARFAIDTPNGLVELSDESSAGIFVDGRDVSVHAFRGSEMALRPWSTASGSPVSISLNEGESITLIERPDGKMDIERGKCYANFFASQISMYSDALTISEDYVRKVRSRNPILYWRFENNLEQDNQVHNEVGERYAGTIFGSIQQRERNGNQFIEFGASSLIDSTLPRIEADEYFADEVKDNYSLEVWIKPNHYHLGSVVSFVDKEPVRGDTGIIESPHGLLLEIGGPRTTQTTIEQPGKIRSLHRSPPSGRLKGSTCFSSLSYEPRKWQHLVVVKEGPAMRIYLNGVLTGSGEDATPLSNGLMLIVGQLDRWRSARMYVGQLDELAFYPTALSSDEVQNHFEIARLKERQEPLKKQIELLQSSDDI